MKTRTITKTREEGTDTHRMMMMITNILGHLLLSMGRRKHIGTIATEEPSYNFICTIDSVLKIKTMGGVPIVALHVSSKA